MKFVYSTTKGYRGRFFLLLLSVLFGTVTGAMFPFVTGKIVDEIFYKQQMKGFLLYFFLYAGLYFLNQCGHGALNYLWAHLEASYVVEIRRRMFRHLLRMKAAVWTNVKSGDVMKRIMDDTECFLEFIHRSLFYVLANFLQLAISIGYLLYTNWLLGLVSIILTPVMAWSIRYFAAKLKARQEKIRNQRGLAEAWILEMMTGISQWKLLNAQEKVKRDYEAKTRKVIEEEVGAGYQELASANVNEGLTLLGQLCVYCIAAFCIVRDTITVGQFVACAAYFATCASYYNALGRKITDIAGNLAGIGRVRELLEWETEEDLPGAKDMEIKRGRICFREVSFGYEEQEIHGGTVRDKDSGEGAAGEEKFGSKLPNIELMSKEGVCTPSYEADRRYNYILKNFSLQIEAGEKVAFVGKSGEGKSTLLQLLCRLYEPLKGGIYVDGVNIKEFTLSSLRQQVAVVQQENGLFHGSLRENIILSDDPGQDALIWEILEGLKLKELVEQWPEGLDTVIGSGSREMSGGQKQRIAIARCIYRQPKILLLDEATSALDEATEREVNAFVYERLPDTTILTVAHRFSTVLAAGKAVVIEQGRAAAVGDHPFLMKESELYRTLYEEYRQAGGRISTEAGESFSVGIDVSSSAGADGSSSAGALRAFPTDTGGRKERDLI